MSDDLETSLSIRSRVFLTENQNFYAYMCEEAICSPLVIESLNVELANADFYLSTAMLSFTLEMRSPASNVQRMLMWCTYHFFQEFVRAICRCDVLNQSVEIRVGERSSLRVREFVTYDPSARMLAYEPPFKILLLPKGNSVVAVAGQWRDARIRELFYLPRSKKFLGAFTKAMGVVNSYADETILYLNEEARIAREARERIARANSTLPMLLIGSPKKLWV